jgi:hypothetical protein
MTTTKTTHKGLPPAAAVDFEVKPPFKIMEDNRRRFIRIDIDEPITFNAIKTTDGGFWPEGDGPGGNGEVLNISAGGILMFCTEPVMENNILSLSVKIEGCEAINHILGKVKRVEIDSGGYLVGLESITREKLADHLSEEEIDELPKDMASFTDRLRVFLNQYIYSKKLSTEHENF